ncbi:MAG: cupin domain-containing protein [Caulobacterales bacterium]|nr:cupin domain-containing protein [Caulobacterales bacterium]
MSTQALNVRRVVTGHDAQGKAIVVSDNLAQTSSPRPGHQICAVWANDGVPADNLNTRDGADIAAASRLPNGATFRIVQHAPGAESRMHRTQTLDYGVVLQGCIVLELDNSVEITLRAGDVLVQRGTIHKWINRGETPCTIAFVLLDARPLHLPSTQ